MAYQIEITYSNGYRCGCCARDWEYNEEVDTLEEALERVPIDLVDGQPLMFNGDMEVTKVSVTDPEGEEIAFASALWSQGYGRYSGYSFTRWGGYRPDSGGFESVYDSGRKRVEQSWSEVTTDLSEQQRKKDLEKAERDLAEAQSRIARLSKD